MKWITRESLETQFGISWAVAEAIIRRECRSIRRDQGRTSLAIALLCVGGLFWCSGGAGLVFHSTDRGGRALIELPGLLLLVFALLVLPRLLATKAILSAAQAAAGDRSILASEDAAIAADRPAPR